MIKKFTNERFVDFNKEENKNEMLNALKRLDAAKGKEYPLIINGEKIYTQDKIISYNPSKYNEIIGMTACADTVLAEKAINTADNAFNSWKNTTVIERSSYLLKAAAIIRSSKFDFSALLVEEAGKTWREADADTAEAIDFLEYYGRQMLRLAEGVEITPYKGENNICQYIPLGVGVIISPWNFPLAILAGMTAAAIVTGNTVVIKPASTTPVIAAKFMNIWEAIGLPAGVINFLPGSGSAIGDYLVSHPKTRFINFTGSKDVGLRINKLAAEISPGQKWIKRVVAEMGGKDAIIVDNNADIEAAAEGIITSAFGFQGQKCSACSRAIIVEDVYDEMLKRLREKAAKLKIGSACDSESSLGPVIDRKAYDKIMNYIKTGISEGRLIIGGKGNDKKGFFIEPTIIADIKSKAVIAQEEIFGPVLAVLKAKDFNDAIDIANDTDYGLTGAVYSNNRVKLEKAVKEFHVGNLYLNRKCTGALVGVNPFGGFNMSGTDSKAGGPDYLTLFMQLKTIAEQY